jgi:hypothetical protein
VPPRDPTDLLRRLEEGEWLQVGDVAALLNLSPKTVDRRIAEGVIGVRTKAGSTWRLCNPIDVRRLLEESYTERRGTD